MHLNKNIVAFWMILLLLGCYLWSIFSYTSFMPIADDYGAVLSFLNAFVAEDNILNKFKMLFLQHSEHRIVFNRIVEIIQLKLFGEVNFLHLILVGNLGWLLSVWLLWKHMKRDTLASAWSFVPVVLIMLSFSHAALMTWAMASLQQYWQLYFSLLSIYFLVNDKRNISILFMSLAIFTGGGGMALIPLTLFYYMLRKEWKNIIFIVSISLFIVYIYFIALDFQRHARDLSMTYILLHQTKMLVSYIFVFLGNIGYSVKYAMYAGILFFILFLSQAKVFYKKDLFILWSIIFIILTASIVGLSRSGSGLIQAMSSRYAIYSTLFLALLYMGYARKYQYHKFVVFIGYTIGIGLFVFYYNVKIPAFQERKIIAETKLDYPEGFAENVLRKSEYMGTFTAFKQLILPPQVLQATYKKSNFTYDISVESIRLNNTTKEKKTIFLLPSSTSINISGWIEDSKTISKSCGVIAILEHQKHLFFSYRQIDTPNGTHYHFNGKLDVARLNTSKHILELRLLHEDCRHYGELLEIDIYKDNLKTYLSLPSVIYPLRGWIDKFTQHNGIIDIVGWYSIVDHPSKSKMLLLEIDGKKYLTRYGYNTQAVADILNNQAYKRAGFRLALDKNKIGRGKHKVKVFMLADDLSTWYEDTHIYEFISQ